MVRGTAVPNGRRRAECTPIVASKGALAKQRSAVVAAVVRGRPAMRQAAATLQTWRVHVHKEVAIVVPSCRLPCLTAVVSLILPGCRLIAGAVVSKRGAVGGGSVCLSAVS